MWEFLETFTFSGAVAAYADVLFVWGWLLLLMLILWIAWEAYILLKRIDYVSSIEWTFFEVTLPEESLETPKAMENAIEVWGGIHKNPDIVERYFDGYLLAWYSLELRCTPGRVQYLMVVPTAHRKFFEGVVYGQYPAANLTEVPDYTQEYSFENLEKTFDLYGTEITLAKDDLYPIRTYREFEDALAEDDRYIDPLQALIEAFTTINEGEEFWVQILVKPIDAGEIDAWSQQGEELINEISGRETKKAGQGLVAGLLSQLVQFPLTLLKAFFAPPAAEESSNDDRPEFRFLNPAEEATVKGIFQKISRTGFRCKIRLIHISPAGQLFKPNISKGIGAFKQFNTFHLNSVKPDSATKSNGPNLFMKQSRRRYRKRVNLLNYQWRDFFGDTSGYMLTAEEIATLYHFPSKYVRTPSVSRAPAGLGSAPDNVPYT